MIGNITRRVGKKLHERHGFTLVEMIIAFALSAALLAMVSTVMISYTSIFGRVSAFSRSRSVAEMLTDEISGRLSTASNRIVVSGGNSTIAFVDSDNFNIIISEMNGKLNVRYEEITDPNTGTVIYEQSDWYYSEKAYQNNILTAVRFRVIEGTNLIHVSLTLQNAIFGSEYTTESVIECFNIEPSLIETNEDSVFYE